MQQYQTKFNPNNYESGGMVEGPSHEEGGVSAVDGSGEQIAEVQGGERIFSDEDSQQIEAMAQEAMAMEQQNPEQAEAAFAQLGRFVAQSMVAQEQVNPSQGGIAGDTSMQGPPEEDFEAQLI